MVESTFNFIGLRLYATLFQKLQSFFSDKQRLFFVVDAVSEALLLLRYASFKSPFV